MIRRYKSLLLILLLTHFGASSYAQLGSRGGGLGSRIYKDEIKQLLTDSSLKNLEVQYLDGLNIALIKNPTIKGNTVDVQSMLMTLLNGDINSDILLSKYNTDGVCPSGIDGNKSASTFIGIRNSEICFDVNMLSSDFTTPATLIALALHEHAHHYGYGENEAYALSQIVGADILRRDGQYQLNSAAASSGLLGQLKPGSLISVKSDISTLRAPVFQNGKVYDGTSGLQPGVYCSYSAPSLYKGNYKVIEVLTAFTATRLVQNSNGAWVPNGQDPTSTTASIMFSNGSFLSCNRFPDIGAQVSLGEFENAVIGSMTLRAKK